MRESRLTERRALRLRCSDFRPSTCLGVKKALWRHDFWQELQGAGDCGEGLPLRAMSFYEQLA